MEHINLNTKDCRHKRHLRAMSQRNDSLSRQNQQLERYNRILNEALIVGIALTIIHIFYRISI